MTKIYKVEIEKLAFDTGSFAGYKLVGYYTNENKANRIAKEEYDRRNLMIEGKTRVTEIEVDDEE